ncbi:phosphoglycolate phosphatase [Sulfurovum sp. ST-21]|uniref:Phosphoglycolate phosphatase n=1 Tax=Sulfurovum indicum TaxID=2779528 RepID=A0A7M1S138_9BACT|nr:phosphoglycolate phosphatase [Sulfurovum indicum]QOR60964.1 phosphoglycolate phosphatase [Sulfurovum indicum]
MKFRNKKAIFFDLDGTLIDSVPDLALAVNEMLTILGKETFSEDTIRYWVGNGAQTLVKRALLGRREVENERIDETYFKKAHTIFLEAYGKHLCKATRPYPHVVETLEALKSRGYRLTIITNKPEQFVEPILKGLGFDDLFETYLGGDSLPKKKPDPMPLLHMCDLLGLTVESCVMVGDSKNDILAANACGMQSIGVTYGYNYGEEISIYEPDAVVNDFSNISELF